MVNKALLYGIVGFMLGGFVVSSAAVYLEKPEASNKVSTAEHNAEATANLKELRGDEFDKAFIAEMIMHHQGAIDMAKLIEANAKHDELKQLGGEIISAQSKEIDLMRAWQSDWGYKPHEAH